MLLTTDDYQKFQEILANDVPMQEVYAFINTIKTHYTNFDEVLALLFEISEKKNKIVMMIILKESRADFYRYRGDDYYAFLEYLDSYILCDKALPQELVFGLYVKLIEVTLDLGFFVLCLFICKQATSFVKNLHHERYSDQIALLHLKCLYFSKAYDDAIEQFHDVYTKILPHIKNDDQQAFILYYGMSLFKAMHYSSAYSCVKAASMYLHANPHHPSIPFIDILKGHIEELLHHKQSRSIDFTLPLQLIHQHPDPLMEVELYLLLAKINYEVASTFEYWIEKAFALIPSLKKNLQLLHFDDVLTTLFPQDRPLIARYRTLVKMNELRQKIFKEESHELVNAMERLTYRSDYQIEQRVTFELTHISKIGAQFNHYGTLESVLKQIFKTIESYIPISTFGYAYCEDHQLHCKEIHKEGQEYYYKVNDINLTLYARCFANNEIIHIENLCHEYHKYFNQNIECLHFNQTQLFLPLQFDDNTRTIISFQCVDPYQFSKKIVYTFMILSTYIAFNLRSNLLISLAKFEAEHDSLTKTFNHRKILSLTEEILEMNDHVSGLIMIDIDYFKSINDTYGHLVGDYALLHLVKILQSSLRKVDSLGRYGGEEFLILLPDVSFHELQIISERIRTNVMEQPLFTDDHQISFTISIGAILMQDPHRPVKDYINQVDEALYQSKNTGRNKVTIL